MFRRAQKNSPLLIGQKKTTKVHPSWGALTFVAAFYSPLPTLGGG